MLSSSSSSSSSSSIDKAIYDKLKAEYDDYIESSKELETELEKELDNERKECHQIKQKLLIVQDKLGEENKKSGQYLSENNAIQSKYSSLLEKYNDSEARKRSLESVNEDLSAQIRILESTIEDLKHKLDNAEEDIVFLSTDIDELKWSKQEIEQRLNSEILDLQAKLGNITSQSQTSIDIPNVHTSKSNDNNDNNDNKNNNNDNDDNELRQTIDKNMELEIELEEMRIKLSESEQQNVELNNEVTNMTDELLSQHENVQELQGQISKLNEHIEVLNNQPNEAEVLVQDLQQQIAVLNKQIERLGKTQRRESESSECPGPSLPMVVSSQDSMVLSEVNDKILQMEKLNMKLIQQAADVKDAQDAVIKELEEKVMMLSTQSAAVEKDRNELLIAIERNEKLRDNDKKLHEQEIVKLTTELRNKHHHHHQQQQQQQQLSNGDNNSDSFSLPVAGGGSLNTNDPAAIGVELEKQAAISRALREHNAKLLHRLQSVVGNIQVYCRTRPPLGNELAQKKCVDVLDNTEVTCYDNRAETWRSFIYDRVWAHTATQADVFADIEPMVLSVVDGFNTCLLAYGQTGSGKTYTMNGYDKEYGISYRSLHKIFSALAMRRQQAESDSQKSEHLMRKLSDLKNNSKSNSNSNSNNGSDMSDANIESSSPRAREVTTTPFSYSVSVSMVEIYNEQLRDLLVEGPPTGTTLEIRQAVDGGTAIPGLKQVQVNSIDDVMAVFARGSAIRATSATNVNEHSSRSHSILVVEVTTCTEGSSPVKAKLFLVDLAGSERVAKSGVTGTALNEAKYINKSLSALGDVMEALDQKSKHVPYRNSKLTHFLQDSLGGNSKTMMIITTCPTDYTAEETLFTLQFASRVRNISVGPAKRNFNTKNLEEAVKLLKQEVATSHRNTKRMEEQLAELKKENKRLQEKNHDVRMKSFEELKKINSVSTPSPSPSPSPSVNNNSGHISVTKSKQLHYTAEDGSDVTPAAKDRQSISMGTRTSKVPIPVTSRTSSSPFATTPAAADRFEPKLSSASQDSNKEKETITTTPSSSSSSSSSKQSSSIQSSSVSRLKPKTDIHSIADSTPKKREDRVAKEEVPETSHSEQIKTTIDLATRRRIAQRSAETLIKHKERMEARRNKQADDSLVLVRR